MKSLIRCGSCLMLFWIVLILAGPVYAAVIQVSNTSDSGDGSFRQAISTANISGEADTIIFTSGLEAGTLFLLTELPMPESDLTIDGTYAPLIDGSSIISGPMHGGQDYTVLYIQNQSNITISGLRITGLRYGIVVWDAVSNITIEGCTITCVHDVGEHSYCILIHPQSGLVSQNLSFINNTFENAGIGIHPLGSSTVQGVTISGNTVINGTIDLNTANTDYAIVENVMISDNVLNGRGIMLLANHEGNTSDHCTISNVTIKGNMVEGDSIQADIDSGTDNHISGLVIKNNRVTRDDGEGIRLANDADRASNSIDVVIENNIAVNCGSEGIQVQGGIDASVVNNFVAGNREGLAFYAGPTILAANNLVTKNTQGIVLENEDEFPNDNIQLFNNMVVSNCLIGIGGESPIDPRPLTLELGYNNFWDNNGTNYRNVTPGVGDISVDPEFVDAAAGDYHLSDGSPCIDAGYPDLAYGDSWTGKGGPRADIGLYGGPGADELFFSIPIVDYKPGIYYAQVENNHFSPAIASLWGGNNYGLHIMVGTSPCTVVEAKALGPPAFSQEHELFNDGSNGDIIADDSQFETTLFSINPPIPGQWKIVVTTSQETFEATVVSGGNQLAIPEPFYPINGDPIPETLTTELWWYFVEDTIDGYRILVYDGLPATFGIEGLVYMDEVDSETQWTEIPPGVLEPGKMYYWIVQSFYSEDFGDIESVMAAMGVGSFTTPPIVIADFTASPTSGGFPLEVTFTDMSQGPVASWSWNFGNGQTSAEQNPTTTFENAGQYTVSLTVMDNPVTDEDTKTKTDYIDAHAIVAEINNSPSGTINQTDYVLFVGGQDVVAYSYRLDNDGWSDSILLHTPIGFSIETDGEHTLEVVGQDQAGALQVVPTSVTWTVDTSAPVVSITTPDDASTYTADEIGTIEASAVDDSNPIASVEFQVTDGIFFLTYPSGQVANETWIVGDVLSGNNWWIDTSSFSWIPGKNYTIAARATDSAGNVSTDAIWVTVHDSQSGLAWTNLSLDLSAQSVQIGQPVTVSGKLTRLPVGDPPVSMEGQTIALTIKNAQGVVVPPEDTTTTTDAQGNYNFDIPTDEAVSGLYYLSTSFTGSGTLYQSVSENNLLVVGNHPGYAIVVQGRIPSDTEGLATHNKTLTRIYRRLVDRGLTDDNIYYFNYAFVSPGDPQGVDAAPTKAEIRSAIETWAANRMNAIAAPLYIVLVDHGNRDAFYVDGQTTISPSDLDAWLNTLDGRLDEEAIEEKRCVIIGACYSGSFIPAISKAGRVVVTSAAQDEESFKGPLEPDGIRSGEFFMEEFFHDLELGRSFKKAFGNAVLRSEIYTRRGDSQVNSYNPYFDGAIQHPLLDDNGDGIGSNVLSVGIGDGQSADDLYLGVGTTQASRPVDISSVSETQYLDQASSAAMLSAHANEVGSSWIEIRRPAETLGNAGGTGQLTTPSERHGMDWDVTETRWEKSDFAFNETGKYEVFYFHYDGDVETNDISSMQRSLVYKDKDGNNPPAAFSLLAPVNGSSPKTVLLFDWEDAVDPDPGNDVTYKLIIDDNSDFSSAEFVREEITLSLTYIDLSAGLQDATTYYWKVLAVDPYGARTWSTETTWSFTTNNTNAFPGWVNGIVYNRMNNEPLVGARVNISLGGVYADSAENGYYLMIVPTGIATMSTSMEGFEDTVLSGVRIPEGGVLELNIGMLPSGAETDTLAPISSASLPGGSYDEGQAVELTCVDPGGSGCGDIFYTTDGSEPTSGANIYAEPIMICNDTTLKFYAKDAAGNNETVHTLVYMVAAGQNEGSVDGDCLVELSDAILALQVIAGIDPGTTVSLQADVDGNDDIGMAEVIYILQKMAGIRN